MKINISNILMYIFLFLFIYFPPILSFNILHILSIFIIVTSVNNYKSLLNIYIKSKLYIFTIFYCVGITYFIMQSFFIGDMHPNNIYQLFLLGFEIPICLIYVYQFISKRKISFEKFVKMLIIVSFVQSIFSLLAYLLPSFQTSVLNLLISNGLNTVNQDFIGYRSFGLATNLTSTTPTFQGIMFVCCVYFSLKKNIKYLLFALPIAFSCVINSRTAIVIMAFGLLVLFVYMSIGSKNKIKNTMKFLIVFIVGLVAFDNVLMPFMKEYSYSTYMWINNGMDEVLSFINGDSVGYFEVANSFIIFPKGLALLFGSNSTVISDVGYILNLWSGGIIYCFIIYMPFLINVVKVMLYKTSIQWKVIIFYIFISLCVLEFKGSIVRQNEVMILFMMIVGWKNLFYEEIFNGL